ncbi:hypothetical protein [Streptomyces sp. NPDC003077]
MSNGADHVNGYNLYDNEIVSPADENEQPDETVSDNGDDEEKG